MSNTEDLVLQIARQVGNLGLQSGPGQLGKLTLDVHQGVTRIFKAHWSPFRIAIPGKVIVLRCSLGESEEYYWTEGYISPKIPPSWVISFRSVPPPEEVIRFEDSDDPAEAVDQFFNYTSFYALKTTGAQWQQLGFEVGPGVEWTQQHDQIVSSPIGPYVEEALKRSDIIWLGLGPDHTAATIPVWFTYKEGKIYVLSGEQQQRIPGAHGLKEVYITARWKMRDAKLADFHARARPITAEDPEEFDRIAEMLWTKRQSANPNAQETLDRWRRECVILELTPQV